MPLFRVAGISVGANWTWLLALGYLIVVLTGNFSDMLGTDGGVEPFAFAVGVSFLFFGSIVLHEFGHAIVARRNGIGVLGIDLWMLGGLAKLDRDPQTPGVEFRVAAAGPLVTAAVAAVCLGTAFALDPTDAAELVRFRDRPGQDPWVAGLAWLGVVNLFLLVFNLIPAYPLDGGRIARAATWKLTGDRHRATVISAALGRAFGWVLGGLGVLALAAGAALDGVILLFMAFTLTQAARGAVAGSGLLGEAAALKVLDVMDVSPVALPGGATVDRALEEYFWRYRWPWFPVVDGTGRFLGLVEQHAVERIDEGDRAGRAVAELIAPGSGVDRAVDQETPLTAVLSNPAIRDYGALMAVDDGGLLRGVVTIEQVQRALREAIARATAQRPPD